MTADELLQLVRETGEALNVWEEIQQRSRGASPLDSSNVVVTNNREAIAAYTRAGKMRQALLDAAREYANSHK